tara:strand:+ start:157 stop:678 length:522 start_codon:yes stop_codon:yes gene_type:complete
MNHSIGHKEQSLEDINNKLEALSNLTQKTLAFGANDTLGNTPRCLTVDGNGRLLTYPYEHPNSWTNTHLSSIKDSLNSIRGNNSIYLTSSSQIDSQINTSIDLDGYSGISFYGTASDDFYLEYSGDNTNFFQDESTFPMNNTFIVFKKNIPRYIRIKNGYNPQTITAHYTLIV